VPLSLLTTKAVFPSGVTATPIGNEACRARPPRLATHPLVARRPEGLQDAGRTLVRRLWH
jgi:hypothetical protein